MDIIFNAHIRSYNWLRILPISIGIKAVSRWLQRGGGQQIKQIFTIFYYYLIQKINLVHVT
jgi:hypothetical protein